MLHGIGGRTIDEAKRGMSYDEALLWQAYREKHGSLNTGSRVELAAAIVAQQVNASIPRKAGAVVPGLTDFMPHYRELVEGDGGAEDEAALLQRAMMEW